MSKYKKGDKVVIRKDLEVDEYYGDFYWSIDKEYMKEKDYVVIEELYDCDYLVDDGYCITDEMIECLYDEVNIKTKYNIGDKVVIKKDLEVGEYSGVEWCIEMDYLKEKYYVVIERVDDDGDYFVECEWYINDEMIAGLYEGNNKPKYKIGDKVLIPKILKLKCGNLDYLVVTGYKYTHHYTTYELNNEFIIEERMLEGLYEGFNTKNQLDYNEIEYVNYKMQHEDLHQSIYKYNLQCQIDKALDENNTELLIELSNLIEGGVMIDI